MIPDSEPEERGFTVKLGWAGPLQGEHGHLLDALRSHASVTMLESATTGAETVRIIRSGTVEAVVTPLLWADLTRAIRLSAGLPAGGPTPLIAVAESATRPVLVKALVNGFDGIVATDEGWDALVRRIRGIIDGHHRLEEEPALQALGITAGLLTRELVIDDAEDRIIADLVGTGMPDDDIARAMDLSVQRVRNRIEFILSRNELAYRTQLAVIRASVVNVPDFA